MKNEDFDPTAKIGPQVQVVTKRLTSEDRTPIAFYMMGANDNPIPDNTYHMMIHNNHTGFRAYVLCSAGMTIELPIGQELKFTIETSSGGVGLIDKISLVGTCIRTNINGSQTLYDYFTGIFYKDSLVTFRIK